MAAKIKFGDYCSVEGEKLLSPEQFRVSGASLSGKGYAFIIEIDGKCYVVDGPKDELVESFRYALANLSLPDDDDEDNDEEDGDEDDE